MKCVICKSDNIHKKRVQEEIKRSVDIAAVFLDILVCFDCGERYYDGKTMRQIERGHAATYADRVNCGSGRPQGFRGQCHTGSQANK